jgi:putative SOS response-associated peptidase YedK
MSRIFMPPLNTAAQDAFSDLARAQRALVVAENHFDWTTEAEHNRCALDSTIYTLNAAALRLRAAVQRAKQAEAMSRPRARKAS